MPTYTFPPISVTRKKSGKCPVCGKRVTRSRTFMQTVNPWNKNTDGTTRTHTEVGTAVRDEANAWVPDFTHGACAETSSPDAFAR
ncbi:hypothetical protein [Nocardia sp. MW-W600-9]